MTIADKNDLPTLIDFCHELADIARHTTLSYFRQGFEIDIKSDDSPVTVADRNTENKLREAIQQRYPMHHILGEEFGASELSSDSDWQWTLDPIDGTQSFVCGVPLFGSLISLQHQHKPLIGIIEMPALGERFVGHWDADQQHYVGCQHSVEAQKQPLATSAVDALNSVRLMAAHPDMFDNKTWPKFKSLSDRCQITRYSADCYAYALLAMGQIDIVAEDDMKPHDYRALLPVIRAAGGVVTDWQGNALDDCDTTSTVLATANQTLHEQALRQLR